MKKCIILPLLVISTLFVLNCDTRTSTDEYLKGDFVDTLEDTTPPSQLYPPDGEKFTSAYPTLQWTAKQGAATYYIEIFTEKGDKGIPVDLLGSEAFTVTAPQTSMKLKEKLEEKGLALESKTYYWRVYADTTGLDETTGKQQYEESTFHYVGDTLYVYCPADADTCSDAACVNADDNTTVIDCIGNKSYPYQTITGAIIEARRLGVTTIKIATRTTSDKTIKAYSESVSLSQNISLLGGYDTSFKDEMRDVANSKTLINYDSSIGLKISDVYSQMTIEGLNFSGSDQTYASFGAKLNSLGTEVIIKNCVFTVGASEKSNSFGIYNNDSGVQVENTTITVGNATVGSSYGVYNTNYSMSSITSSSLTIGGSKAEGVGIFASDFCQITITNNTITVGVSDAKSYGVYAYTSALDIQGNTIDVGDGASSYGVNIDNKDALSMAVKISSNAITAGNGNGSGVFDGSAGVKITSSDNAVINSNTISAGEGYYSYGVKIDSVQMFSFKNNHITSGTATDESYGAYVMNSMIDMINNIIKSGSTTTDDSGMEKSCALLIERVTYTGSGTPYSKVFNNTLISGSSLTASYGLYANTDSSIVITLVNNIIHTAEGSSNKYGINNNAASVTFNNTFNLVWTNGGTDYVSVSAGTGDVIGSDPQLDSSYKLTVSSPVDARYGGTDLSGTFTTDYDGTTRTTSSSGQSNGGSGWSIGAFEY